MKKFFSLLLSCALALVLVACGNNSTGGGKLTTTVGGSTQKTTKTQVFEDYLSDVQLEGESVSIAFWNIWGKDKSAVLTSMIEEFAAMMKSEYDCDVTIASTSQSDYPTLLEKTNKAIASGDKSALPNLVIGYPDHFAGYLKSKAIVSLEEYVNDITYGVDINDYIETYMDENNQFGGVTYSLPFSKSAEILTYNKSMLDSLGITIKYDTPLTWTEIMGYKDAVLGKAATETTEAVQGWSKDYTVGSETVTVKPLYVLNYDSSDNLFINFNRQLNAKYTSSDGSIAFMESETQVAASTTRVVRYIENYITNKYLSVPVNYEPTAKYGSSYFTQQLMPFTVGSTAGATYNIPTQVKTADKIYEVFEAGTAMVPQFVTDTEGNAATKSVVQQGPNICLLDAGTEVDKLVAWLFVKYMTAQNKWDASLNSFVDGQNNSARLAIETGYFPVTESAYSSALYQDYMNVAMRYYTKQFTGKYYEDRELTREIADIDAFIEAWEANEKAKFEADPTYKIKECEYYGEWVDKSADDKYVYPEATYIAEKSRWSIDGFSPKEMTQLFRSQVAYVCYLQRDYYKYDPAFAASNRLLGSASIREKAEALVNEIALDPSLDPAQALIKMYNNCKVN